MSKSSHLRSLKEENEKLQNQLQFHKAKENDLQLEYNELKNKEEKLSKEKNNLNSSIKSYQDKSKELSHQNEDNNESLNRIKKQISTANDEIEDLEQKNREEKRKIEKLESSLHDYESQIEDLKKKISEIKGGNHDRDNPNPGDIPSAIIRSSSQWNLIKEWIGIRDDYTFKRLYNGREQEFSARSFHQHVDGNQYTLILIKEGKSNSIIGGFTKETWEGTGYKEDEMAFLFNLSYEKRYQVNNPAKAIYCEPNYLSIFGEGDLVLADNRLTTDFPITYGRHEEKYALTQGSSSLLLEDFEVFQLIPNRY